MISFNASFAWKLTEMSSDMAASTGIAALASGPIFPNVIAASTRTCCCSSLSAWIKSGTATAADGPNHPRVRITAERSKGVMTFSLPRRLETVVSSGRTATRKPSINRSLTLPCSSDHLTGNWYSSGRICNSNWLNPGLHFYTVSRASCLRSSCANMDANTGNNSMALGSRAWPSSNVIAASSKLPIAK